MKERILVVEDDVFIQDLLASILEGEGYNVDRAGSGGELLDQMEQKVPDLVLLDLGLPDEDGLVMLRQLRARSQVPVIILTTRQDIEDRISALELGADDFVTKPANPRELVLRIKRSLARSGTRTMMTEQQTAPLMQGNWTIDLSSRILRHEQRGEIPLTRSEFDLLATLFLAPDIVLSRSRLLDAVARGDASPSDRTIDVLISRLRRKMERNPRRPTLIVTVSGLGYKLSSAGARAEMDKAAS